MREARPIDPRLLALFTRLVRRGRPKYVAHARVGRYAERLGLWWPCHRLIQRRVATGALDLSAADAWRGRLRVVVCEN